jgi:hypothetical protein
MTKTLRFEGFSDDTFGELTTREDYDNCASGEPITFLVKSSEGELMVQGQYCPGPATGWLIGIARHDEDDDKPIPAWPMHFEHAEREYSPRLVIEAPDDVTVSHYVPNDDD